MTSEKMRSEIVALVLLVPPLCYGIARIPSVEDSAKTDYVAKLNELVGRGQDENLNAGSSYNKALDLCIGPPTAVNARTVKCWPTDLTAEQRAMVEAWVNVNSDALAQLQAGAQKPQYWFQYHGSSVWNLEELDYFTRVRKPLWALVLRTKLKAARGDAKGAIDDLLLCYRISSDMKKRLLVWEQLAAMAALEYNLETGFQILDRTEPNGDLLCYLQERLVALSTNADFLFDLAPHELVQLDAIQKVYGLWYENQRKTDMERVGGLESAALEEVASQLSKMLGARLTAEEVHSSMHNHTPTELIVLVRKGQAYYNSLILKTPFQWKKDAIDFAKQWKNLTGGNPLLLALAPDVSGLSELSFRCRAEKDALIAVLSLLRYKDKCGTFPRDLRELGIAGYMRELPMDPYSDKPLVYRLTENNFTLYSIGADLQDNGGKHSSKWGQDMQGGDFVFWPVPNRRE